MRSKWKRFASNIGYGGDIRENDLMTVNISHKAGLVYSAPAKSTESLGTFLLTESDGRPDMSEKKQEAVSSE